jgi:polyphosphate:AMP phosphotransferase
VFESAELGHKIDKAVYEAEAPALREKLLDAQYDLVESKKFAMVILIGGVDGAGKGETVNLLNEWMDPRHIQTHAMATPSDEERDHPAMWRFWRALPPKGKIGIFFGSWYTQPIVARAYGLTKTAELDQAMDRVLRFEQMLAGEGVLVQKLWFHLSREQQQKRLTTLEKDPKTRWRVTPTDWEHFRIYDKFRKVSERALRKTSTADAPWVIVEGADARYRSLTVGTAVHAALRSRLDAQQAPAEPHVPPLLRPLDQLDVLRRLDMSVKLEKETYEDKLEKWQRKVNLHMRRPEAKRLGVAMVFEGPDAAGKGGAIRRVTAALDARQYQVIPIAAPTEEERAQPYLWRFWRHVPRPGKLAIFDRSWYGRVLVERVEGYCSKADYLRAYGEINDFEEQLAKHGVVVVKYWLHITAEEQLERFREREQTGFKRFKITAEDWRNRDKWNAYHDAVCDMIERTSTSAAPWTVVEANDKYHARVKVLSTLAERLDGALDKLR